MKSMLSEVRLERPIHDGYVSTESLIQELLEQEAMLKAALVAAMGVIESAGAYEQKYAELAADTGSINQDWRGLDRLKRKASVAYAELETALGPFKVAGDDTKDGV